MPEPKPSPGAGAAIPIVAESVRIDKRVVETGRTVIHKTVSERDETIEALLERRDVTVERVPVGRVVAEPPAPRRDGEDWIIPVLEERLVVEKQLVLKEELRIRTIRTHEPVRETVRLREEHVDIETSASRADASAPRASG